MKVAVGLRRVAAGKRTSGRRAAQIAIIPYLFSWYPAGNDICGLSSSYKVFGELADRSHPSEQGVLMQYGTFPDPRITDFFGQGTAARIILCNHGVKIAQHF